MPTCILPSLSWTDKQNKTHDASPVFLCLQTETSQLWEDWKYAAFFWIYFCWLTKDACFFPRNKKYQVLYTKIYLQGTVYRYQRGRIYFILLFSYSIRKVFHLCKNPYRRKKERSESNASLDAKCPGFS